ncbi:MAG: TRAP transporter small permease [Candidatus Limnocylindrales bacterium]
MRALTRSLDAFAWFLEHVVALAFATLFAVVVLNIVLRNVAGIAWLWIPAVARLLFVWIVFLGVAAALRRNEHLVVDFFQRRMPRRLQKAVVLGIHLVSLPFFAMLLVYGLQVARVRMRIPFDTWQFPTGWAYMAVPVAAVILIVFTLERLASTIWERRTP